MMSRTRADFLALYPVAPSFTSFQCWGWEKLVQEECSPADGQQLMSSLGCLWGLGLIRCPAFLPRWEMWQCETRKWSSDQSEKLENNNKPALLLLLWVCGCVACFWVKYPYRFLSGTRQSWTGKKSCQRRNRTASTKPLNKIICLVNVS